MFNIFKRNGNYVVPQVKSLKSIDSATKGNKRGKKTSEEKMADASEKLRIAQENGEEKMLSKGKSKSKKASKEVKVPVVPPAEGAGAIPPK